MKREEVKVGLVTTGLAVWLIATAACQLPDQRFDALLRRGRLRIPTPNWRFFGPNPGTTDTHLLYRDIGADGPSDWKEVPVGEDRPWHSLAWNARNRAPKALFDAAQMTLAVAADTAGDLEVVSLSPAYIYLVRYLRRHLEHAGETSAIQFLLVESKRTSAHDRAITPVFASQQIPLSVAAC
ncbi:hypothetical protein GCM10010271_67870 [Streptomyces kurssanovii]|nr:hypothetical protein GCM10010271_67870 [Streptomyces kurssanovii]